MTGPLTTAQAEQAAAVKWIERGYVTCARCGDLVGDRTHLEGHWCSGRRSA